DTMLRVRAAFDPSGLCNPGKIIPLPRGCGEGRAVATQQLSEPGAIATGSIDPTQITKSSPQPGTNFVNLRLAERINEVRVINELKRMVNAANVKKLVDSAIGKTEFASDNQRALIVTPEIASEVSEVLSLARHEGLSVIPAGNLSWVDVGNRVAEVDLI